LSFARLSKGPTGSSYQGAIREIAIIRMETSTLGGGLKC
jgi:hypothetical protein